MEALQFSVIGAAASWSPIRTSPFQKPRSLRLRRFRFDDEALDLNPPESQAIKTKTNYSLEKVDLERLSNFPPIIKFLLTSQLRLNSGALRYIAGLSIENTLRLSLEDFAGMSEEEKNSLR